MAATSPPRRSRALPGIAEGTIFRVFPDKRSLFLAAAEEAMNPAGGEQAFDEALAGVTDLRDGIVLVTNRVLDRMRLTMSVMMAVRPQLIAAFHEEKEAGRKPQIGPAGLRPQGAGGPPRRLTRLFEPYADRLAVDPATAAIALRSLIFGAHRPELGMAPSLTTDQIADLVLGGVLARKDL